MKSNSQRVAEHAKRKAEKGLKKIYTWAHPEDFEKIRAYVKRQNKSRGVL